MNKELDWPRIAHLMKTGIAAALKLTEEKWLFDLYGQDYADYRKRVNRCIPWPPHNI